MAAIRQPSFASGELAPSLWGRTDSPRYATGARLLSNFFVSKQGNAVSRPGAQYLLQASKTLSTVNIGTIAAPDWVNYTSGAGVRLIGFNWSDTSTDQNAVLEFGEQSIRVISNGAYVATVSGSIPYHRADLWKIRVAQSLDVMYVACPGYAPAKISRTSSTSWAWAAVDFSRNGPTSPSIVPSLDETSVGVADATRPAKAWSWVVTEIRKDPQGLVYETAPTKLQRGWIWNGLAWNSNVQYTQGSLISYSGIYYYAGSSGGVADIPRGVAPGGGAGALWILVAAYNSGTTYTSTQWALDGSGVPYHSKSSGNVGHPLSDTTWWERYDTTYQSDPVTGAGWMGWLFNGSGEAVIPLTADRGVQLWAWPQGANDSQFICYRWYRGRSGLYGFVGDTSSSLFYDTGQEPDLTQQPPQGYNPFILPDSSTDYPGAVCFFEDRLVLAGTSTRPAEIFASATGDYQNMDQRLTPQADDAVSVNIVSRNRQIIRSVVGGDKLFVFTNASIWAIDGSQGSPLTPASVEARMQVDIGSDWPEPIQVAGSLLWVRNKGTGVRRVGFDFESGKFQSQDLSIASEHLVLGHKIVDWAYAEDPWSLVWLVREDGVLLSLTYAPDDNLWAWAEHGVLGPGGNAAVVQSVCSIVEGDEDVLYLAVQGPAAPAYATGVTYNQGDLAVFVDGHTYASAIDGNTFADYANTAHWIQVQNTNQASWILRLSTRQEVGGKSPACLDSYLEYDNPATGGTVFFSGMSHLATVPVSAVGVSANGVESKLGSATVGSNGVVGFVVPTGTSKVYIGLPYNCDLELLDLAQAKDKQKSVSQAALEIRALGAPQVGTDSANLKSWAGYAPQVVANSPPNYYLVKVPVVSTWDNYGRVYLRQSDPLPITVLGVTREVDLGAR